MISFIYIKKKIFFKKGTSNEASDPRTLFLSKVGPAYAPEGGRGTLKAYENVQGKVRDQGKAYVRYKKIANSVGDFSLHISMINPFVPNAPFLYPLKTSENRKLFSYFQGVEKGCTGNEWVKQVSNLLISCLTSSKHLSAGYKSVTSK